MMAAKSLVDLVGQVVKGFVTDINGLQRNRKMMMDKQGQSRFIDDYQ